MVRINYHAHNGFPYFPVGRELIDRGIVPKEEMSMQRIREWMDADPEPAKDVRRKNRSYVFFREVKLGENDEPHGAQGVALTPGRSIAVDKSLHVYGTPFYIHARLPLEGENAATPFQDWWWRRIPARRLSAPRAPTFILVRAMRRAAYRADCGTMRNS